MIFRHSKINDLPTIMSIINEAKVYFKSSGIDQWQGEYPQEEIIKEDIDNNVSYVLEVNNQVSAIASIIFGVEETYNEIFNGEWLSNGAYATIHRIAVKNNCKGMGLSNFLIQHVETLCNERNIKSIKVDTHKNNLVMNKLLLKSGFKYCGIIFLTDGNERLAYEKLI